MTVTPTARQHPWACHVDMSPLVVGVPLASAMTGARGRSAQEDA